MSVYKWFQNATNPDGKRSISGIFPYRLVSTATDREKINQAAVTAINQADQFPPTRSISSAAPPSERFTAFIVFPKRQLKLRRTTLLSHFMVKGS